MADESMMFCQKDLQTASFTALEDMRKTGHLCDLTITVQNHSFSAHRVILAAAIPYFKTLFDQLESDEKEISVENLDPKVLESLIHFAYTNKVNISAENVQSLLQAAKFLGLAQVVEACLAFVSKKTDSVKKENTLDCFCNNSDVIRSYSHIVRQSFEEFSKGEEFLNFPFPLFKEILSRDDLNISSEETAFEAIIKWVKFCPSKREAILPDLLKEIRLADLSLEYLIERVDSEELIVSSRPCRELMKEVKYYHLRPGQQTLSCEWKIYPRSCLKNDLYAICACSNCRSCVYRFDCNKSKWFIFGSIDGWYLTRKSVVLKDEIYSFFKNRVMIFQLKTREWKWLETEEMNLEGVAIVSCESKIYFIGGYLNGISLDSMCCFDAEKNQYRKHNMPIREAYAAAASLGESIYITGGGTTTVYQELAVYGKDCDTNRVKKYNLSSGQWRDVAPMLMKRSGHCCTALNGKIYVFGDESIRGEVYDPLTNLWNYLHFPNSSGKCISLVSGYNKIHAFTDAGWEIYDTRTKTYQKRNQCPSKGLQIVVSLRRGNIQTDYCGLPNE